MHIRHVAAAVIVVFGIVVGSTVVSADGHRAGLFAAYSKASGSTLHGVHVAYDTLFKPKPERYKYVTLMGDFSAHNGKHNGEDVTLITVMVGAHFSRALSDDGRGRQHSVGAHWLGGGVFNDGNSPATAVGATYDFVFKPDRAGLALRVQYDRVFRGGDAVGYDRMSFGGVWRWPQSPK